jgi:hypothetical protein
MVPAVRKVVSGDALEQLQSVLRAATPIPDNYSFVAVSGADRLNGEVLLQSTEAVSRQRG